MPHFMEHKCSLPHIWGSTTCASPRSAVIPPVTQHDIYCPLHWNNRVIMQPVHWVIMC